MRHVRGPLLLLSLGLTAAVGCDQVPSSACVGDACEKPAVTSFESDLPTSSQSGGKGNLSGAAGATASAPSADGAAENAGQADDGSSSSLARTISEADIIQVQGDILYALSREAGLAVIDVHAPDALKLLGRYRELPAQPFELYLRDGVALVMFAGWGQYVKVGDDYSWVSTSKVLALDVSDPAHITSVGNFDVPGTISDSRMVGDVLYLVGYENGYCWGCSDSKPRTSITSLGVADPHHVQKIDELFYADANGQYGSGPKSITVTDKRIYVSGPEYGEKPVGSTIQVVDISDPNGDLVEGAKVQVTGTISSRWQMDEYANTLRVVSQTPQWWTNSGVITTDPVIETFAVASSNELTPLGKATIKLPIQNETLRSVRFDGERGYAITAEQKDPLFTIDLHDPAAPRVVGELEMPGFVWHMEPRGERMLGVGFDQGNPAGSLAVSLFDVKDLANPVLLSRVNFGGSWASLPEDQDRAHKVFKVLDDAGLILVPFSGWNNFDVTSDCSRYGGYTGGVQLIDYHDDTLQARGAAAVRGQARRAFLHQDRLLTVSDQHVQTFDIADHDKPAQTSHVVLSRQVNQAFQLDNDALALVSYDPYSGQPRLTFVGADAADDANSSLAELDFTALIEESNTQCNAGLSIDQFFVNGSELDILYTAYDYNSKGNSKRGLLVVDASDPSAPKIAAKTSWGLDDNWQQYYGYYNYGYYNDATSIVRTAHALATLESSWTYTPVSSEQKVRLRIVDLRDPAHIGSTTVPLTELALYSGLLADGDTLLTSHMVVNEKNIARGRFYVDRFDLTDPSAPQQLPSVNVPGALMQYDAVSQRAITSEQKRIEVPDLTYSQCYERFAFAEWSSSSPTIFVTATAGSASAIPGSGGKGGSDDSTPAAPVPTVQPVDPTGPCAGYQQHLHLVKLDTSSATLEDTLTLEEKQQVSGSSMGDGVLFANVSPNNYYFGGAYAVSDIGYCEGSYCGGYGSAVQQPTQLLVLGGFGSGKFAVGHLNVEHDDANSSNGWWGFWGRNSVYASGTRAILVGSGDAAIVDASTPSAPRIVKKVDLYAWSNSVDVRNGVALLALGAQGVQWIPLY